MTTLLLTLILFAQGIPVLPGQSGTVTGVLKTADGKAAVGVRMAAVARPDTPLDAATGAAMASIAETDEAGRYRLENIPPGRYYIAAGRVDLQTFYPGTLEFGAGTVILVTPGAVLTGLDFVMGAASAGRADQASAPLAPLPVPLSVSLEGGAKLPMFAAGGYTMLRLTRTVDSARIEEPLNAAAITIPALSTQAAAEYRVSVENLPDGYLVKSMTSGSTNLLTDTLKVSLSAGVAVSATGGSVTITSPQAYFQYLRVFMGGQPAPPTTIAITLARGAPSQPARSGVRVTGQGNVPGPRQIYISDRPGILYWDGSFEFSGVPPGRHAIVTLDNPIASEALAASVIVGDRDVEGVELKATPVLPFNVRSARSAIAGTPTDAPPPGTVLPLATLRGRVANDATTEPAIEGTVFLVGHSWAAVRIDPQNRFEIPALLSGSYDLEIQAPGHATVKRSIVVGDEDIDLDLSAAF